MQGIEAKSSPSRMAIASHFSVLASSVVIPATTLTKCVGGGYNYVGSILSIV